MALKQDTEKAGRVLAIVADYQRVFNTESGKRVLRRMMKECGFLTPSFVPGDSHGTAFNEGKRAALLDICNRMKLDIKKIEHEMTRVPIEDNEDYID